MKIKKVRESDIKAPFQRGPWCQSPWSETSGGAYAIEVRRGEVVTLGSSLPTETRTAEVREVS